MQEITFSQAYSDIAIMVEMDDLPRDFIFNDYKMKVYPSTTEDDLWRDYILHSEYVKRIMRSNT